MFDVKKLSAIQIGLASPDAIRKWSHGEVLKPETINYRSQKPDMGGLYCEKIFGPSKDYECHCGKYKRIRYKGYVCEKCGVEVTTKDVRRERMGHIELASPCTHIWYLKGIPSRIAILLDVSPKNLEEVAYYAGHFCLNPGKSSKLVAREFIDEKNGRDVFIPAVSEVLDDPMKFGLIQGTEAYAQGERVLASLKNTGEVFPYESATRFLKKWTGAEFSEGAKAIQTLLKELDLDAIAEDLKDKIEKTKTDQNRLKYTKRLEVVEAFRKSKNKPEWMVLDVIPVIPPDLRPMLALDGGRFATSDLNDLYRRVISRNDRLKRMINISAPEVILNNEKRMLQEAVDALIDNGRRNRPVNGTSNRPLKSLSSGLKGKQGRFRQNLLGKRVDYSGRSVIAVGPFLKMYQCGLPREMAVQLLRPYIVCELMQNKVANSHKQADKMIDDYDPLVLDAIEKIISKHPVLLNRAPTLHRLGIQAFQPVLVDGRAIRLHPLVCTGFNADFDGDQMAVHVPLSKAAQEEALNLMLASNNILAPSNGKPIVTPSQDMVLGNYYLTLESTKEDFLRKAMELESRKDYDEADKYRLYAESEGKVFRSVDDVFLAYQTGQIHLHNRVAILGKALMKKGFTDEMNESYLITSVGKIIFNSIFPTDFPYLNKVDSHNLASDQIKYFAKRGSNIKEIIERAPLYPPFKKGDLGKIINEIFQRYDRKGNPKTSSVLDKMKDQGFGYSTVAGFTVAFSDIFTIEEKDEILRASDEKVERISDMYREGLLTDEERHNQVVKVWKAANDQVDNALRAKFAKNTRNTIYMMSDSGARGKFANISQLSGMRGLMGNTSGGTIEIPVKACFREGMSVSEFFIATHGARKGSADTALKTADSGYLTRRLVDVSQDVIVREVDCGTDHGSIVSEIIQKGEKEDSVVATLEERLIGRYSLNEIVNPQTGEVIVPENTMINEEEAKAIAKAGIKEVEIRSLFGCETKDGVCVHCYGRNMATGREVEIGEAVGIMAAQSIGEPGTQLTMRTFHTGGIAGSDITQGLPRVTELFEARPPKGQAIISKISGTVKSIREDGGFHVVVIENGLDVKEEDTTYTTPFGARVIVEEGDEIKAGDRITDGPISPKELLSVASSADVEKYIVEEVKKVYNAQEIGISDKHIEVIVRQMLRKVQIINGGDTNLLTGTRASISVLTRENEKAILSGKRPAVFSPLILGITKAALETDSFLSAASFQETTRVLTDAAIKAKVDYLHGLKENVITGRIIPAGRGLLDDAKEKALLADFTVEKTMKSVQDRYVEEHERAVQELHDKIEKMREDNKN